jgi:hypothetical protein
MVRGGDGRAGGKQALRLPCLGATGWAGRGGLRTYPAGPPGLQCRWLPRSASQPARPNPPTHLER